MHQALDAPTSAGLHRSLSALKGICDSLSSNIDGPVSFSQNFLTLAMKHMLGGNAKLVCLMNVDATSLVSELDVVQLLAFGQCLRKVRFVQKKNWVDPRRGLLDAKLQNLQLEHDKLSVSMIQLSFDFRY